MIALLLTVCLFTLAASAAMISQSALLPSFVLGALSLSGSYNPDQMTYGLLALSGFSIVVAAWQRQNQPAGAKLAAIAAALFIAHAARLGWKTSVAISPLVLWAIAFALSILTGFIFRHVSSQRTSLECSIDHEAATPPDKMGIGSWLAFFLIAATSGYLYQLRLMHIPGELNSFGTQAMSAANRLLHNEVAWKDLILFREMTQEECGNSLPFVLWHALFQTLFGGLSVFAGRLACATASWLSVMMMFRVARHISGTMGGLFAMATYAFLPLTIFDARFEGIFGFSALIILIIIDVAFSYLRKPTLSRAILLGLCMPLAGYGIANIRFSAVIILLAVLYVLILRRQLLRRSGHLFTAAVITLLFLIPQFMNLSRVINHVKGRGEHIFGGVLSQLAAIDPDKPSGTQKALEILTENIRYLGTSILGPWTDNMTSLPSGLCAVFVVGVGLALGTLRRPDRLFLTGLCAASFFAPLIAIPIGWTRILMLNIPQALIIASVWGDSYTLLRQIRARCPVGLLASLAVVTSLLSVIPTLEFFYRQNPSISQVRDFIIESGRGNVVFFTDQHETSGNFMRWNPPTLGRDSRAHIPIIGIREESVPAITQLIETLRIPGLIVSNRAAPAEMEASSTWKISKVTNEVWAMRYQPLDALSHPTIQVMEPKKLDRNSPVFLERLSYQASRLFLTSLTATPLTLQLHTVATYQQYAILVRGKNSFSAPVEIMIDDGRVPVVASGYVEQEKNSTWYHGGLLPAGEHTVRISLVATPPPNTALIEDVVLIGVP